MKFGESVAAFLRKNTGKNFCDACLQEKLRVKARTRVEYATLRLGVTQGFRKEFAACSVCGKVRRVIRGL